MDGVSASSVLTHPIASFQKKELIKLQYFSRGSAVPCRGRLTKPEPLCSLFSQFRIPTY